MPRTDSIYEANGHSIKVTTTTYFDDLMSEYLCTCGSSASGFLSVGKAEAAAKYHADFYANPDHERHNIVGDVMRQHHGKPDACGCITITREA